MKKITLALILGCLTLNSFAAEGSQFNNFSNNSKKGEFLRDKINNELFIPGISESYACEGVSKFIKLNENKDILFLQVSCQNMDDDYQVLLPKKMNSFSSVNTCKEAEEKYSPKTRCQKKL